MDEHTFLVRKRQNKSAVNLKSNEDEPQQKKAKLFCNKWLNVPAFKNWLRPYIKEKTKAKCILCNVVLLAGLSELTKHAQTRKHMYEEQQLECNKYGTISSHNGQDEQFVEEYVTDSSLNSRENIIVISAGNKTSKQPEQIKKKNHKKDVNFLSKKTSISLCRAIVSFPAPLWKTVAIVNGHVTELKLTNYRGHYLIMIFYPHNFDALSANEMNIISDNIKRFRLLNTEVVACSFDSYKSHKAWMKVGKKNGGVACLQFPILSDMNHKISDLYGCYENNLGHNLRATYIIDKEGILRHISINDVNCGRSLKNLFVLIETIRLIDVDKAKMQRGKLILS